MLFEKYLCGGAVRDFILGIEHKDEDYVVPNMNETQYESLFPTHKKVGNHFPVYLNELNQEIALARTEKSTGNSYTEFACSSGVSLEEDSTRRDFTINSLYMSSDKTVLDFVGGIKDIKNKIIRTINEKCFEEDPLRILRAIRFSLRFNFTIEEYTFKQMRDNSFRLQYLSIERVDLELKKVYEQCSNPSNFFRILDDIGGLSFAGFEEFGIAKTILAGKPEHHPEGDILSHLLLSFDEAKKNNYSFSVAIAALLHDLGKIESPEPPSHIGHELKIHVLNNFFIKHKFDSYTMTLSSIVFKNHMRTHCLCDIKKYTKLFKFVTSIRKQFREDFFNSCDCDSTLTQKQIDIIENVCYIIDNTKFDISKEIIDKGKDVIKNYIENVYYHKYKEIINERTC